MTRKLFAVFPIIALCVSAALLALPQKSEAAVTVDAVGPSAAGTGEPDPTENELSWSHTVSGSDTLLVVGIGIGFFDNQPTASVTYNGDALTSAGILVHTLEGFVQMFYRVAPDPGTNTVQVTLTGDAAWSIVAGSVSFNGVDQVTPISNFASSDGTGSTPSVNVTSATGNMVVDVIAAARPIVSSTQTMQWNNDLNTDTASGNGAQATAAGASSVTMQYNIGTADDSGILAMNINAAAERSVLVKPPNNLGLIGYWPMNEATTTTVGDFSGNGNTGLFDDWSGIGTLPTWANGKRGAAISFVSDDYIALANSTTLDPGTGTYAVSAWFYATAPCGGGSECFIFNDYGTSDIGAVNLYIGTTGNLNGDFRDDAGNECNGSTNPTPVSNGQWHHVVWVRDSQITCKLYLDGIMVASDTDALLGTITVSTGDIPIIGALDGGDEAHFTGRIDEVRIYKNRVISAADVAKLYAGGTSGAARANASSAVLSGNTPLGPPGGLVGHWTFDGADIQSAIIDRAGTNHGYFTGGATNTAKTIGKLGQALTFDGVNDYVQTSSINFSAPFSISQWVYLGQLVPPSGSYAFWNDSNCYFSFDENEVLNYWNNGGVGAGSFGAAITPGSWRHVVFVVGASAITAYVDGSAYGSPLSSTYDCGGAGAVQMGGGTNPSAFLYGKLDDARVYNRALTAPEVNQLYKLGNVRITQ